MRIKKKYPPNIKKIEEKFGELPSTVIYTYGDTVYVPSGGKLSKDLRVHEKTHVEQQGDDPEGWWDKYLEDDLFRLKQETEAYVNQYRYFKNNCKIKSRIPMFLDKVAKDLSSHIYGNIVTFEQAKKLIENFNHIKKWNEEIFEKDIL